MMFKGPSHFKQLVRSVCAVLIAACSGAMAQDNGELAFCAEGERFYPDGQIVEVGDRFLKICAGKFALPPKTTHGFVNFDHQDWLDDATGSQFPGLRYIGFIHNVTKGEPSRPYARLNVDVGQVDLGGLTYDVLESKESAERLARPVAKGSLSDSPLLHFPGKAGNDTPPHFLFCVGDPTKSPPPDQYSCTLNVRYEKSDHLYVTTYISYAKGFPFARAPFNFERLGWQARGMEFVAEHMDVTDRLDEFEGVPIARAEQ